MPIQKQSTISNQTDNDRNETTTRTTIKIIITTTVKITQYEQNFLIIFIIFAPLKKIVLYAYENIMIQILMIIIIFTLFLKIPYNFSSLINVEKKTN